MGGIGQPVASRIRFIIWKFAHTAAAAAAADGDETATSAWRTASRSTPRMSAVANARSSTPRAGVGRRRRGRRRAGRAVSRSSWRSHGASLRG